MTDDATGSVWITSSRAPGDLCKITWDGTDWYASVADVRTTAADLMTCAAYAEMMMHLAATLQLPAGVVSGLVSHMLSSTGRTMFGTPATVSLMPAGSTKRREALVLIKHHGTGPGKREGMVAAKVAREMATGWFATAEATESDQLVAAVLPEICNATPGQVEALFARLRELREEGPAR